jgi:hypothetical protein
MAKSLPDPIFPDGVWDGATDKWPDITTDKTPDVEFGARYRAEIRSLEANLQPYLEIIDIISDFGPPHSLLGVTADGTSIEYKIIHSIQATNDNAGTIVIGQPVYTKANGNVDLAKADDANTAEIAGLVSDATIATSQDGNIQVTGIVTATTAEWDAVAGTTGGLTPGAFYYISAVTAGELTETPPTIVSQVGYALSSTELNLTFQSGGFPAGSDTQVQYNDSGSFGADAGFTTDKAGSITLVGIITGGTVTDGVLSINSGSITSAVDGTFSGTVTAGELTLTPQSAVINFGLGGVSGDTLTFQTSGTTFNSFFKFRNGAKGFDVAVGPAGSSNFNSDGPLNFVAIDGGIAFRISDASSMIFSSLNFNFENGDVHIEDHKKLILGTANDVSIYYDETDFVLDSQEIGSGNFNFKSGIIKVEGVQTIYNAQALDSFTGSLIIGNGGINLSHAAGDEGYYNTFVGIGSGLDTTTGAFNTAIGAYTLDNNTTGTNNTATGFHSLHANIDGNHNTANGFQALAANTSGLRNLASGYQALNANTEGEKNTALGARALYSCLTTEGNTGVGFRALYAATGGYNTSNGAYSLYDMLGGTYNTSLGYNTGRGITTGNYNTIIGAQVTGLASGLSNYVIIADGQGNQRIVVDSTGQVAIPADVKILIGAEGDCSIEYNGTDMVFDSQEAGTGNFNFKSGVIEVEGLQTIYNAQALDNFTGSLIVGNGGGSLSHSAGIDGYYNIFMGFDAGEDTTTGYYNIAIGFQALNSTTTGKRNVAIGSLALPLSTDVDNNVAVGHQTLGSNTNGDYNVAIGMEAFYDLTHGQYNTAIGYNTGRGITTGSYNTIIGAQVTGLSSSLANYVIISDGQGNQRLVIDNNGNAEINGDLKIDGKFSSGVTTVSVVGPTDNVDVDACNVVFLDTTSNNVTIGGFINGVVGQVIRVVRLSSANDATLEHNEGTGNQDIFLASEADHTISTYGGWTLVCDGSNWLEVGY